MEKRRRGFTFRSNLTGEDDTAQRYHSTDDNLRSRWILVAAVQFDSFFAELARAVVVSRSCAKCRA